MAGSGFHPQAVVVGFQGLLSRRETTPHLPLLHGGFYRGKIFSTNAATPPANPSSERTLKLSAPPPGLHFRLAAAPSIEPRGEHDYAVGDKLLIRITSPAILRTAGKQKELLVPAQPEMRVEYRFGKLRMYIYVVCLSTSG